MFSNVKHNVESVKSAPEFVIVKEELDENVCAADEPSTSTSVYMERNKQNIENKFSSDDMSFVNTSEQLQNDLMEEDGTEAGTSYLGDDVVIKEEIEFTDVSSNFAESLDNKKYSLEVSSSSFNYDSNNQYECSENENANPSSHLLVPNLSSDSFVLLSSDTENRTKYSFNYKEVKSVKQEYVESETDFVPIAIYLDEYHGSTESVYPSVEHISKDTQIKSEENAQRLLDTSSYVLSKSDRRNNKGETVQTTAVNESANEIDKISQQSPVGRRVKQEPDVKKENNVCSNSCEMNPEDEQGKKIASTGMRDTTKTRTFQCEICERKFLSPFDLKRHIVIHSMEKPFKCNTCGYKCTQSSSLKLHMRIHSGEKPFKCEICQFKFSRKSHLQSHMKTHSGERPYQCELCEYRCSEISNMKRHIMTHTGEKSLECNICGYKCILGGSLKRHMRSHTGERPYECKICGYKSSRSCSLKKHMRLHSGERPYKCEKCEYAANESSSLRRHIMTHTGEKPFKCDICSRKFSAGNDLKRHTRSHTGLKPFNCNICRSKFTSGSSLKRHMKTHEGVRP